MSMSSLCYFVDMQTDSSLCNFTFIHIQELVAGKCVLSFVFLTRAQPDSG